MATFLDLTGKLACLMFVAAYVSLWFAGAMFAWFFAVWVIQLGEKQEQVEREERLLYRTKLTNTRMQMMHDEFNVK